MSKRGAIVAIEGLDGAGKTTVAKWLVEQLINMGIKAEYTYEPTDSKFVEALKSYSNVRTPQLDALAYAADRLVHLYDLVIPLIDQGYVVVMDRYFYSSIAYQGAMGVPTSWIMDVNRYAIPPDLAIYIDVDPEVGLHRVKSKNASRRFKEYESLKLLREARRIYLKLVEEGLLVYVNGMRSLEEVEIDVLRHVSTRLRLPLFTK
ncbi:MAG: dTMP kinase [Sulfolobales archaeon]|nr:dTMP kinase [Sulfolobales archaeon]MCX8198669.1 dTMP kinase [Sulfolobales archaeon]MDW8169742.1 dTMP kinase [Desulfurococcaceae archaeon]